MNLKARFSNQLDIKMWERKILERAEIYNIPKLVTLLAVVIKLRNNQPKGQWDLFWFMV